jgi:hypothetical protein
VDNKVVVTNAKKIGYNPNLAAEERDLLLKKPEKRKKIDVSKVDFTKTDYDKYMNN